MAISGIFDRLEKNTSVTQVDITKNIAIRIKRTQIFLYLVRRATVHIPATKQIRDTQWEILRANAKTRSVINKGLLMGLVREVWVV